MSGLAEVPMNAIRDAEPISGTFPVVIYAPSLNSVNTENIELCEYLASHGFIVFASPSLGANERVMAADVAGADAQASDISFLINFSKNVPDTNTAEIAVIGYSFGGMAELFAAARDQRIKALVALDGSFLYDAATVQRVTDVHPDRLTVPLLFFSRGQDPLAERDNPQTDGPASKSTVLNNWTHGDLLHVDLLAASHITFSSIYQRSERFRSGALQFVPADYSLEDGAETYNWMARYTLEFLMSYLKNDADGASFLKRSPAENGVPKHLMAFYFRQASSIKNVSKQ